MMQYNIERTISALRIIQQSNGLAYLASSVERNYCIAALLVYKAT